MILGKPWRCLQQATVLQYEIVGLYVHQEGRYKEHLWHMMIAATEQSVFDYGLVTQPLGFGVRASRAP